MNDAAAPSHAWPGIGIHAIDIAQPPGIGISPLADMEPHQTVVSAALAAKSSAEVPKKAGCEVRSKVMGRDLLSRKSIASVAPQLTSCDVVQAAFSAVTFSALCGVKAANWRSSALSGPVRQDSAIDRDTGSKKNILFAVLQPIEDAQGGGPGRSKTVLFSIFIPFSFRSLSFCLLLRIARRGGYVLSRTNLAAKELSAIGGSIGEFPDGQQTGTYK
ncbi:MAG: hypothetical protein WA623_01825 [Candidatus Sulfotelmatobacter sp.]